MGEFEKAFTSLNDEQKRAVLTVDGPVLVIAGPGTGKTQLLSTRVAHILKTTDTKPGNILCLTFTNKAAINMKERIISLAGQDGAKIVARTFHSFAAEIMNLYPDYFWSAAPLSVAPESVQLDIIESIVSGLPLDNPLALKFAGQYTLISDIQRSINLAKDAGLTPDKLRSLINVNLAYIDTIEEQLVDICGQKLSAKNLDALRRSVEVLPKQNIDRTVYPLTSLSTVISESLEQAILQDADSGRTSNTGRWKSRWIQIVAGKRGMFDERRRNQWWLELARVYEKYRDAIHERGFYDYADMLVEVIAQLEQNPEMLASIQERFSYVLLDEFQDTNPAQLRLAHLVTDHPLLEGKPNLMAVGDDDQSIFKFNGAELNNMLGFKRTYKTAEVVILTKNYRSSQQVLDSAKKIIEQAETRLVNVDKSLNKNLAAENPPDEKGEIRVLAYSSRELQLSEIARDIQRRYSPDKRIAVLARGHDSLIKMAGILQGLEVPVRYEQQSNILEHDIVDQVYLVISLLIAIRDGDRNSVDALIHQIIRHPMWGVDVKRLWVLAANNYPGGDWLESLLSSDSDGLKRLGEWFVELAQLADNQPLAVTIEQVIGLRPTGGFISPIKNYFIGDNHADINKYFHSLSAIQLLRALVHEFGRSSEPSLGELKRFVEINKANGRIVADESPFITGSHAVQLLTVHKAKGLEFDDVYIIDAIEDNWQPKKGGRKPPANLPLQPVGDDMDDYARLFYVAFTRARSSVTISAYYQDHAGKDLAISPLIQSAFDVRKVEENDQTKLIEVLEENLHWPELGNGQESAILKARLEGYSLSATHLLNFLDVSSGGPQYFKEKNLLHLPELKKVNLSYGTAMHDAMEYAQKLINKDMFDLKKVLGEFEKSLLSEQVTSAEFGRFKPQGFAVLKRLFTDFKYKLPKGSVPEQKIKDVRLGQAVIQGNLDRIDIEGNSISIIDYKTGGPLSSFDTKDKNKLIKAYKHKLQLTFYTILVSEHPSLSKYEEITGQMVYLEAQSPQELMRSYTPIKPEVDYLKRLIEAVWQRIMTLDLPDISSYSPDIDGIKEFESDLLKE